MPYRHTVGPRTHVFADLATLMAKATPVRSGDCLAGIAAPTIALALVGGAVADRLPRRAMLYLGLAVATMCFWIFSAPEVKFTTIPLIFGLGSLTLLLKGIFLLRRSSEGLGLSSLELADLSDASNRKSLPSLPTRLLRSFRISASARSFSDLF